MCRLQRVGCIFLNRKTRRLVFIISSMSAHFVNCLTAIKWITAQPWAGFYLSTELVEFNILTIYKEL